MTPTSRARDEALEEAAKAIDKLANEAYEASDQAYAQGIIAVGKFEQAKFTAFQQAARAIRALKETPHA